MNKGKPIQSKWILLLVLLLLTSGMFTALAKYITEERVKAEAVSAGFFVSSDYLRVGGADYDVIDSGKTAKLQLYNYEQANVAKVSEIDVKYKVEVNGGSCAVTGIDDTDAEGYYTISGGTATNHELVITADAGEDEVTVTVTTAPFKEVLSVTLKFSGETALESEVNHSETHSVLTIHSNDYKGVVNVKWNESAFVPDNTNEIMEDWTNSGAENFTADDHQVYEMIFFKIADGSANLTVEVE